jgi:hypothetical protein
MGSTVCEERAERTIETPRDDGNLTGWDLEPGQCKSIQPGTSDWWCGRTCTSVAACPKEVCECGALPQEDAPINTDPIWECDDEWFRRPEGTACGSIHPDQISDYACENACYSCTVCPPLLCMCGPEMEKKKREHDKEMINVCDFDAQGCKDMGNGAMSCQSCAIQITSCMTTPHLDEDNNLLEINERDCIEEIASVSQGCEECNTEESVRAWNVRTGNSWEYETPEHMGETQEDNGCCSFVGRCADPCTDGMDYCHEEQGHCEGECGGDWLGEWATPYCEEDPEKKALLKQATRRARAATRARRKGTRESQLLIMKKDGTSAKVRLEPTLVARKDGSSAQVMMPLPDSRRVAHAASQSR